MINKTVVSCEYGYNANSPNNTLVLKFSDSTFIVLESIKDCDTAIEVLKESGLYPYLLHCHGIITEAERDDLVKQNRSRKMAEIDQLIALNL